MSQPQPDSIPRLDLAPKLKRPLQWWNLLDYLRLLHWVFSFLRRCDGMLRRLGVGMSIRGK